MGPIGPFETYISNLFNIYPFLPLLLALKKLKVYSSFYFLSALSIWVTEAIGIRLFSSPIAIACISITNTILLVVVFYLYIKRELQTTVFTSRILLFLSKVLFHSLLTASLIYWSTSAFQESYPPLITLLMAFLLFYLVLVASSRLFGLNYMSILVHLFNSFTNKNHGRSN